MIEINGYKFVNTCMACPEQYDVFKDDKQVGYLRLRWGVFRVDYPNCGNKTIYQHDFNDEWKGIFDDEKERMKYLLLAIEHIKMEENKDK